MASFKDFLKSLARETSITALSGLLHANIDSLTAPGPLSEKSYKVKRPKPKVVKAPKGA